MARTLLLIIAALFNTVHAARVPNKHGTTVAAPTIPVGTPDSTVAATTVPVGDPNCKDSIPNCDTYGHASCTGPYESWAKTHCQAFCGFCIPITSPFVCADKVRCSEYGADLCSNTDYVGFVEKNCVKYCHMCPGDVTTTPIPKTGCFDDFERCDEFGKGTCTGYPNWSKLFCSKYCGFCKSTGETGGVTDAVSTTPASTTVQDLDCFDRRDCSAYDIKTSCCGSYEAFSRYNCARHCRFCAPKVTPAPLCTDTDPICSSYNADLCNNSKYDGFAREHCAGYCKICDRPVYLPECARGNTTTTGSVTVSGQTGPPTSPQSTPTTTPAPGTRCTQDEKYYSQGENWYTADCYKSCTCHDPTTNDIRCGPLRCPKWESNCEVVLVPGACCPILKCNYFNTIHGERTQEGGTLIGK